MTYRSEKPKIARRYHYALLGILLGIGAPVGWLCLRVFGVQAGWIADEFSQRGWVYLYMGVGTSLAFALFGFELGSRSDEIVQEAEEVQREFKRANEMAITDALTGVNNSRYLHDHLAGETDLAKRYNTPLTCVMIDIDDFKHINDTFGHPFGDQVLTGIAQSILERVRQVDVVGRLGGEEFLVVMRHTTAGAAYPVAERIRAAIEKLRFEAGGNEVRVTVSLGIASIPSPMVNDKASLLAGADEALYRAKRAGKNRTYLHGPTVEPLSIHAER